MAMARFSIMLGALLSTTLAWGSEGLAPHRAQYALSQGPKQIESDITGLSGRLEISFEASCDGWHIEEFLAMRLHGPNIDDTPHLSHLEAWEARDGRSYWFATQSYQGASRIDEVGGTASIDRDAGTGQLRFSRPSEQTRPLPPETLFPARHIEALIEAGLAGERHQRSTVFDGTTEESPFEISAFIGRAEPPRDAPASLAGKAAWPLRLAYYALGAVDPQPEFEVSVLMYANGIAGEMLYDYGNFSMKVDLVELELLPVPECDD